MNDVYGYVCEAYRDLIWPICDDPVKLPDEHNHAYWAQVSKQLRLRQIKVKKKGRVEVVSDSEEDDEPPTSMFS